MALLETAILPKHTTKKFIAGSVLRVRTAATATKTHPLNYEPSNPR